GVDPVGLFPFLFVPVTRCRAEAKTTLEKSYAFAGISDGINGLIVFLPGRYSRNCRSETVRSRVNAKYPICVFRQRFIAISMRPRGSGRASPSQMWKMF